MADRTSDSQLERILGDNHSRRDFLRGALIGGAAISVPGLLGAVDEGRAAPLATPRRGGRLRVGLLGGANAEFQDPNTASGAEINVARNRALFEGLVEFDSRGRTVNQLAEELVPNRDASVWTIRLRQGVTFHNGKTLTADDVVYSFKYMIDPVNKTGNGGLLQPVLASSGITKVDARTVRLRLKQPHSLLPQILGERNVKIFPEGSTAEDLDSRPIGTGPFKFESWTRGERSLYVRNPDWSARGAFGPAYVDELEIISVNEATSRLNALAAGQVDAISDVGARLARAVDANPRLALLEGPSSAWTGFYMACNKGLFADKRVRQAFRLMIDRPQMIKSALGGKGKLGNDLTSWFDPNYASGLPQRQHDPERAKALLKQAGRSGLSLTLAASDAAQGMLESATLFTSQARDAGVRIKLKKVPADQYYVVYPRSPWGEVNWGGRAFAPMASFAFLSKAPYNEPRWFRPDFDKLFLKALATTNNAKRRQMLVDAQHILWNDGGYIVWGFPNSLDATSAKLKGLRTSVIRPLNFYDFSSSFIEQ